MIQFQYEYATHTMICITCQSDNIIVVTMKAFDIGELKKTARVKELQANRSYSEIHKSPLRSSTQQPSTPLPESCYLTRWGRGLETRDQSGFVNVGQGIIAVAVGQQHALILNNKNQCYGYGGNAYGQLAQQGENIHKPSPLHALKDMKIMAIYAGAYHSFVQNAKGELYAFGLNLKGQLGLGSCDDKKKPVLVHPLLPGGQKNPKASFFADTLSECKRKQQRKSRDQMPQLANITNLPGFSPMASRGEDDQKPIFLLNHDQIVVKMSCGPLHSVALTNRGRLFACGYGQKFALGTGRPKSATEFTELKVKGSGKIQKIQTGCSSTGYISQGRVWVAGTVGDKVFQSFTALNTGNQEISQIKITEKSLLLLSRKGELYQMGEYFKQNQKCFSQNPKKIQKIQSVRQIFAGPACFFALTENRSLLGWGDNSQGQVSAIGTKGNIVSPQSLRLSLGNPQNIQIISGSTTTFLLSGQKVESPQAQQESKGRGGSVRPGAICGPQQKQLLNELGVQPRAFNCNLQIDFQELVFQSQISQGGYGIIYKGLWRQTTVAIKMFKIQSQSAVRDFFSECAAMQALRHPNIVMFLGACTKAPNFAIVLQFCSRGSLWSNIQNLQLPLSWEQRRRMAIQTARGVHYLHSCKPPVLHRDLKSLNLLLDESGRVKLADFGWTKGLDNYMTGKIGTYQWMAPQVIGSQKYSEKADVFSYGIILWEIASRQPPFKHLSGLQVSIEVLNNDLRPPIPKKTPESFVKLMRRCWDRDPAKRPSFKDIIRELGAMKF